MKTKILLLSVFIISSFAVGSQTTKLVILHTNDTHSQVEPATSNDLGGYARRLGVINQIRKEEKNVVLLDAGDFLQGTPYFNFFGGRVEVKALEMMQYDAIGLGNHEFDNGIDSLVMLLETVKLPMISSNYHFQNTLLAPYLKQYKIIRKGSLKIGVFALGVNLEGLAFQKNYEGIKINNPVLTAKVYSDFLKNRLKCDLVICISHLGINSTESSPTDYDVVNATKHIDVIIGGHSHKVLVNEKKKNADNKDVIIAQMGKSGFNLGRIDLEFESR